MKPSVKILVFSGYGINCEEETKLAFHRSGGIARIGHINDIIEGRFRLSDYQILAIPGGFAYGDDTGSGNAYAVKIKNHLLENLTDFISKDKLLIGICNGFQILTRLGIFPETVLMHNKNARYTVRWVDLKVNNRSVWLKGIKDISLPIAHGEGKFYSTGKTVSKLLKTGQIALKYVKGDNCRFFNLEANPNGSLMSIAGITDISGRILGLMPHPERAQYFHQLPNYTYLKEFYLRQGREIPSYGPGLKIFQNAVNYFSS